MRQFLTALIVFRAHFGREILFPVKYEEGELLENETMRKIGISDFSTKPTNFYNLDVIISVGYRVHSVQGTRFRQWATQCIREYILKGRT